MTANDREIPTAPGSGILPPTSTSTWWWPTSPPASCACPGAGPCLIPVGDYVRVTLKVTDGSGAPLSLTTSPGFRPTDFIPGATPTSNVTGPSVTVDVAYPTSNFAGPANKQNTSTTRSPPITIKFLGYATTKTNAVPVGGLAYAAATYLDPPTNSITNATTGTPENFNRVIECLNKAMGTNIAPEYFDNPYGFFQVKTHADLARANAVLNYKAEWTLEAGIADYVKIMEKLGK